MCEKEEYKNSGIYLLYNRDDNKLYENNYYYIGKSKNIYKRFLQHSRLFCDCNYGIVYQFIISRGEKIQTKTINGVWDFKILSANPAKSAKELNDMEIYFCKLYKPKLTLVMGGGLSNPYRIDEMEKREIKKLYCEKKTEAI